MDVPASAFERLKPVCVPVMRAVTEVSRAREFPGEVEYGPRQEQDVVSALEQLLSQLEELAPDSNALELPRCLDYVLLPLFLLLPPTPEAALEDEAQWRLYYKEKQGKYPVGCLGDRSRELCFRCMSTISSAVGREALHEDTDRVNGVLTRVVLLLGADTSNAPVWSEDCRSAAMQAAMAVFPDDALPPPLDQPLWLARLIHALISEQSAPWSTAGRQVRRLALDVLRVIASLRAISPLHLLPFLPGVASAVSATAAGLRPVHAAADTQDSPSSRSTSLVADGSRLGLAIQAAGCACLAAWIRSCLSDQWLETVRRRQGVVEPPLLDPVPNARDAWLEVATRLGVTRAGHQQQQQQRRHRESFESLTEETSGDRDGSVDVPPWFTLDRLWLERASQRLRTLSVSILTHLTPWATSHGVVTPAVLSLADAIILRAPRAISVEPLREEETKHDSTLLESSRDVDPVQVWTLAAEQVGVLAKLGRATAKDRDQGHTLLQAAWQSLQSQGPTRIDRVRDQIVTRWRTITRELADAEDDRLVARLHSAAVWSTLAPHTLLSASSSPADDGSFFHPTGVMMTGTTFPPLLQPAMERLAALLSPLARDPLPGDARPHVGSGSGWIPAVSLGRARLPRVRSAVAAATEAVGQALVRAEEGSLDACVAACFAMARRKWRSARFHRREEVVGSAGWCALAMGLVEGARRLGIPASDRADPGVTGFEQSWLCSDEDRLRKRICDAARVLLLEAADSQRRSPVDSAPHGDTKADAQEEVSLWDLQSGVVGSSASHAASLVHVMLLECVAVSARVLGPWFVQELPQCAMQLLRRSVDPVECVRRFAQDVWTVLAQYTARCAVEDDDVQWVAAKRDIPPGLSPALAPNATLSSFVTHHWGLLVDGLVAAVESLSSGLSSESDLEVLPRILLFLLPLVRPADTQQERWIPPDRLPWVRDLALALERAVYALRMQSSPVASRSLRLVLRALGAVVDCLAGTSATRDENVPRFLQRNWGARKERDGIRSRVQERLRTALEADNAPEGDGEAREAERQRFRAWNSKPLPLLPRPGLRTTELGLDDGGVPPPSTGEPPPVPIRQLLARVLRVAGRTLVSHDAGVCIAALDVWRSGACALAGAPATLNPLLHDHWGPYLRLWTADQPPVVRIAAIETLVHWVAFGACGSFLQGKVRDSLFPCILSILWETVDRLLQQERPARHHKPIIRRSDLLLGEASPGAATPEMVTPSRVNGDSSTTTEPPPHDLREQQESSGLLPKPPQRLEPEYRVAFTVLHAIRVLSARMAVPAERGAGPETPHGGEDEDEDGDEDNADGDETRQNRGGPTQWTARKRDTRAVEKALERRTAEIAVEAVTGETGVEHDRSRRGLGVSSTSHWSQSQRASGGDDEPRSTSFPTGGQCFWDTPLWEDIAWELSVSASPLASHAAPPPVAAAARDTLRSLGRHIDAHSVWWLSRALRKGPSMTWSPPSEALARLSDPRGTTLADRLAVGPSGDPIGTRERDFLDQSSAPSPSSSSSSRALQHFPGSLALQSQRRSIIGGSAADSDDESEEDENEGEPSGWEMSLRSKQFLDADAWRRERGKAMGSPRSRVSDRRIAREAFVRRAGNHVLARATLEAESSRVETEDGSKPWHPPGQGDPIVRAWHAGAQQSHGAGARRAAYRRLVTGARDWSRLDWNDADLKQVLG